jgi:hypothetical protein
VILLVQQQMIPWTHEISTPSPVHFAVHGGVEFYTFSKTICFVMKLFYTKRIRMKKKEIGREYAESNYVG